MKVRTNLIICCAVSTFCLICAVLVTSVSLVHLIVGAIPLFVFRIYVRIRGFEYLNRPVSKYLPIQCVMVGAAAGGVGDGGRWLGTVLCGIAFGCLGFVEGTRIERQILDIEERSEESSDYDTT